MRRGGREQGGGDVRQLDHGRRILLRQLQRLDDDRRDADVEGECLRALRAATRATGTRIVVGRTVIALFKRRIDNAVAAAGEDAIRSADGTGIVAVADRFVTGFPYFDATVAANGSLGMKR